MLLWSVFIFALAALRTFSEDIIVSKMGTGTMLAPVDGALLLTETLIFLKHGIVQCGCFFCNIYTESYAVKHSVFFIHFCNGRS